MIHDIEVGYYRFKSYIHSFVGFTSLGAVESGLKISVSTALGMTKIRLGSTPARRAVFSLLINFKEMFK